jgi:hypothetical protein
MPNFPMFLGFARNDGGGAWRFGFRMVVALGFTLILAFSRREKGLVGCDRVGYLAYGLAKSRFLRSLRLPAE